MVAAFECRDEKATILASDTFDNRTLNITVLVELVLAVLIAEGALLPSLLKTVDLSGTQWLLGAAPAVVLFLGWELGKLIARKRTEAAPEPGVQVPAHT